MEAKLTITIDELRREVSSLTRDAEASRLIPDPVHRIYEIVIAMRRFQASIVSANAPLGFHPGSEKAEDNRKALRAHRLAGLGSEKAKTGIKQICDWLVSVDSIFLVQHHLWRIENSVRQGFFHQVPRYASR